MVVYEQTSNPTALPLDLPETRGHLRYPDDEENPFIELLIGAATEYAENHTRRAFMSRSFKFYLDEFPARSYIEIPKPPLSAITSLKYYDPDEVQQTWTASTNYYSDIVSEPGRLQMKTGIIWPTVETRRPNAIEIEFVAGYASAALVPDSIKIGMLLMIGHWFENREAVVVGPTGLRVNEVPQSANLLLDQNRVLSFY
jgi:uncharacterized phiE125 gp8 family phage protein